MSELLFDILRGLGFYCLMTVAFVSIAWLVLPDFGGHASLARNFTAAAGGGALFALIAFIILAVAIRAPR